MSLIMQSTIAFSLQETLEDIIDDDTDGVEASADFTKYCDVEEMDSAFIDYAETGGPGLASEVDEGTEIGTASIYEGPIMRHIARKFGIRLIATEEALADGKYPEVINAAKRAKRALWKTADVDAANLLNRMFNSSYVGGDDVCLGSNAHTLPGGGTFSNIFGTAFSPSRASVIVARGQARTYPGHDGVREGYALTGVLCPVEQESVWEGILQSSKVPESNNNEINVAQKLGLKLTPVTHWTASSTNYAFTTDAPEGGLKWYWRKRPEARSWVENSNEVMNYSNSARWARGWNDARGHVCVNA